MKKEKAVLYGNGIDDDYPAIQQMLSSGLSCVYLPAPEKHYVIGQTLKIGSGQELRLDRFTVIRLAAGANCAMLENADFDGGNENIRVSGGIWDMNHNEQWPNPYHFPNPETGENYRETWARLHHSETSRTLVRGCYTGMCFRFCTVKNFTFSDITIKNPVVYGVQCAYMEDFTFENVVFEYNEGSPKLWNLDGIHIEGGCRRGVFRNLKGACHDDLLAFTTDDSLFGPISDMEADGIFAEGCHSAVRLLSTGTPMKNIHIKDIYGSYYVYCVCMTKYHPDRPKNGVFENIVIENVFARFCDGTADVPGHWAPFIQIGADVDINSLSLVNVYRDEDNFPMETLGVEAGAKIDNLVLRSVRQRNFTEKEMPLLKNEGKIGRLVLDGVSAEGGPVLAGKGEIGKKIEI